MAEIKNTFIQSKMNQDLDARIIPNGQYRSALNVSISRSESADVGALETVLGTLEITDFGLSDCNIKAIGHFMDVTNDRIFVFLTNYSDSSPTLLNNTTGSSFSNIECYIAYYDINANTGNIIVGGDWLNFSKTHRIFGVNLIENLLFWTDNRNQPRKINVDNAISNPYIINPPTGTPGQGYYFTEDQISVAKYYPFEPIYLLDLANPITADNRFDAGMKDVVSEWLPPHAVLEVIDPAPGPGGVFITVDGTHTIGSGKTFDTPAFVTDGDRITGPNVTPNPAGVSSDVIVIGASNNPTSTVFEITNQDPTVAAVAVGDVLYLQRRNPYYNAAWPGDPDYLKDKFGRFSYRFKFDDGEYSLIAPFTQIAFVPEQDGYFIADNLNPNDTENSGPDQETQTYRSTVVPFMENKINDIILNIPSPKEYEVSENSMIWSEVNDKLKITEVDVLWKSADDQSIKVIETLPIDYFKNNTTTLLEYNYQSTKPWKTLPTNELTRVSDRVPVRSLGQESAGNRIMYGNFLDKHTSPPPLDYTVIIDEKGPLPDTIAERDDPREYVRKEYQNHTLKQNRTYQVGVVLSDRFGRQSDVILSKVTDDQVGKASTIFHPYRDINSYLITDRNDPQDPNDTWPGDQLIALFNSTIPESISTATGYPGLFSINDGSIQSIKNITGFDPSDWVTGVPACGSGCDITVELICDSAGPGSCGSMSFEICDDGTGVAAINLESIVFSGTEGNFSNGQIISVCTSNVSLFPACWAGGPESCFQVEVVCPENNPLGWYSYKIVVKQTEQEYYNVYLPGMLAGYPEDIIGSAPTISGGILTSPSVIGEKYPSGLEKKECHVVLINDNINKVPRDLQEVGPDQQQFRSSVVLYGRVENVKIEVDGGAFGNLNKQYQPSILGDTVTTIGPMTELNLGKFDKAGVDNANYNFEGAGSEDPLIPPHWYSGDSNPLIARISTKDKIGQPQFGNAAAWSDETMTPFLSVYETEPVESLLDIYWETTTSGLISELNRNIVEQEGVSLARGLSNAQIIIPEQGYADETIPFSAQFWVEGVNGLDLSDASFGCTIDLINVTYADGTVSLPQKFKLINAGVPGKNIYYLVKRFGEYQLAYEDPNKINLKFVFEITQTLSSGSTITITSIVDGIVTNEVPQEFMYPDRGDIKALNYTNFLFPTTLTAVPFGPALTPTCFEGYQPNSEACFLTGGGAGFVGSPYNTGQNYYTPSYEGTQPGGPNVDFVNSCDPYVRKLGKGPVLAAKGMNWSASVDHWDGTFAAKNGIYGSADPPPPNPRSLQTCEELDFVVKRAYQVSAIFCYMNTPTAGVGWRGNGQQNCVCTDEKVSPPFVEYVFGQPMLTIDANGVGLDCTYDADFTPTNGQDASDTSGYESPAYRQSMSKRVVVDLGSIPNSYGVVFADEILNGPQYIDYQPNWGIPNPADNTATGGGEKYVGEKYNNEEHYWMDIDANMKFYTLRRASGDPTDPANFWPLASPLGTYNIYNNGVYPGACGAPTYTAGTGDIVLPFKYGTEDFDPSAPNGGKFTSAWPSGTQGNSLINGQPYGSYNMQEINACTPWGTAGPWSLIGKGNPLSWGPGDHLTISQIPYQYFNEASPLSYSQWKTRAPRFVAKNINTCSFNGGSAKGIIEVEPGIIGGQEWTMPPGRYVVTVAAIDKNGTGLSFEWDVPITIYESAIPEGRFDPQYGSGTPGMLQSTGCNTGLYSSTNPCGCTTYVTPSGGFNSCT